MMSEKDLESNPGIGRIKLEVYSETGELIQKIEEAMHSYTSNFMSLVIGVLDPNAGIILNDVNNSSITISPYGNAILNAVAPSGNDKYGIVIGTGTTQFSVSDYKLDSPLSNSEFSYGQTSYTQSTSGNVLTIGWTRSFINKEAGSVNVTEVGLIAASYDSSGNLSNYFLLTRDVLSTAASVPSNGTLNVTVELTYNPSS